MKKEFYYVLKFTYIQNFKGLKYFFNFQVKSILKKGILMTHRS